MTPTLPAAAALKPCPFCPDGGKPKVESHNVAHGVSDDNCVDGWIVICDASNGGCGAGTGWQESGAEATAAWNRRAPSGQHDAAQGEEVEAVAELLWHRFAGEQEETWADASEPEIYRLAARDAIALAERLSRQTRGRTT